MHKAVCVWASLNFAVVLLETLGRSICAANRSLIDQHLSTANQKRCAGFLGSQLFILGALSNFVFFGGFEVGEVFFRRTYWTGNAVAYGCVSAVCICVFHTSEWVSERKNKSVGVVKT